MLEINKIHCGDCLKLMPGIPDKSIDLILCDLPYGATHAPWDNLIPFQPMWTEYRRIIKDNAAIVLTAQQPFATDLINSARDIFRYDLVWEKTVSGGFLNVNKMPLRSHELVLVFYKHLPTYNPIKTRGDKWERDREDAPLGTYGPIKGIVQTGRGRHPRSVFKFANHSGALWGDTSDVKGHAAAKPVPLFEYLIKTYTNENDTVLDSCIGSGTTALAAINTNRNFIGIEKEISFVEISRKRIAEIPTRLDRFFP